MADLLLTGANGQVGWEIARQAAGLSLHAADRAALDIADAGAVAAAFARFSPKVVINAAAYTAVDKAETDRDGAFAVNRDGAAHLARACADSGATLIHLSTDYVFDGAKNGAWTEDDAVAPLGVYGASKLAGEEAIRALCPRHLILRTAWVHGVHGHNFVKTMLRVGAERDRLRVVDDQSGCPTFAADLAGTVLALADRVLAGPLPTDGFGTFHCAGAGRTTWCGLARSIFARMAPRWGRRPEVEAITTADYPTPACRPANSVLDCRRLRQVHGLALRPWDEALADMLDRLADNEGSSA